MDQKYYDIGELERFSILFPELWNRLYELVYQIRSLSKRIDDPASAKTRSTDIALWIDALHKLPKLLSESNVEYKKRSGSHFLLRIKNFDTLTTQHNIAIVLCADMAVINFDEEEK